MREYRITLTMAALGRPEVAEDNAEALLSAFETTHPEAGPAVGADLVRGTLEVTYSVHAEDANAAFDAGRPIFVDGARRSGLPVSEIIHLDIDAVGAESSTSASCSRPKGSACVATWVCRGGT